MAFYNYQQLTTQVQGWLGYSVLDETTDIPLSIVQQFMNQTIRESLSEWNYRQAESPVLLPFTHTINNVQGAFFSGVSVAPSLIGSGITASITPYPQNSSNGFLVNHTHIETYSGINFIGQDILGNTYSGISNIGTEIRTSVPNIVGMVYEMPSYVERIYAVTIPQNAIKLKYVPQYDFDRAVPQGLVIASGTPSQYSMFPGLSPSGNLMIQFYPEPTITQFSGTLFQIHYTRKHQDMVLPTDYCSLIPEQFQDIIVEGTLEKCYTYLSDDKAQFHGARKAARLEALQDWAENSLDFVYIRRDGNFLSTPTVSPYNTTIQFQI